MTQELRDAASMFAKAELARRRLAAYCEHMDSTYVRAPHLDLLYEHLEALERRDIDKLFVALPPRHGKSRAVAQDFISWHVGRHPEQQVIICAYGSELAEAHSRRVREMVQDERYPFGDVGVNEASRAVDRWGTTKGGLVRATGIGGSLTGFGAHALIIDDPVRDVEAAESALVRESTWAWYSSVARTRLMPNAVQIVCGTRWHEDDLLGRILNSPGAQHWTKLILPALAEDADDPLKRELGAALWPAWYPASKYPSVAEGEISTRQFASLYQQRPVPAEGNLFKYEWFQHRYKTLPDDAPKRDVFGMLTRPLPNIILAGCDAASGTGVGNDFSVIVTALTDRKNFYVTDVRRKRVEFPELLRMLVDVYNEQHPRAIYVEAASNGIAAVQELKRSTGVPIIAVKPQGSKIARAESITPLLESGRVFFPERAPWLDAFISELCSFPAGKHDDQVDALGLALSHLRGAALVSLDSQRITGTLAGQSWRAR